MFKIEKLDKFSVLRAEGFLDKEDYQIINQQLKSIFLFYDKNLRGWKIPKNKEDQTAMFVEKVLKRGVQYDSVIVSKEKQTIFKRSADFDERVLKVKLYDYQKEDVLWGLKRNRAFIASDPGIGKTIESISIFSQLKKEGKIDGILLLVKNNLTFHWKREILEFSSVFSEEDILVVDNKNKKTIFLQDVPPTIVICPNHLLKDIFKQDADLLSLWQKSCLCLVLDESHEFKNSSSKRTQSLYNILSSFHYRYELSATPAINGFEDWYTQMNILDESIIPVNQLVFKMDIAKTMGTKYDPYAITSYRQDKLKEYLEKFKPWVVKRIKSDLPEMKAKQIVKPIYLEMSKKQKAIYKLVKDIYIQKAKLDGGTGGVVYSQIENKYPYLVMAIDNPSMLKSRIVEDPYEDFKQLEPLLTHWSEEDSTKISYLDEFLEQKIKKEREKVVVFDTHPLTLNSMFERYKEYSPLMIHGQLGLSMVDRQKIVDDFNDKHSLNKLILLNVQTGGTGLNLQKACNTVVFFTTPSDSTLYRQALDRTHRINSERDTMITILVYDKSYDDKRCKTNIKRTQVNDYSFKAEIEEYLQDL